MEKNNNELYMKAEWDGRNLLRGKKDDDLLGLVSLAMSAYIVRKNDVYDKYDLQKEIEQYFDDYELKGHFFSFIGEYWEEIVTYSHMAGLKELKSVALSSKELKRDRANFETADSITKLADNLMDIQSGDIVLDNCAGVMNFVMHSMQKHDDVTYHCNEINTNCIIISKIRSWMLDNRIEIHQGNAITQSLHELGANKVFSDFPWALRDERLIDYVRHDIKYAPYFNSFPKTKILDWAFVLASIFSRRDDGVSVVVVPTSMLSRTMRSEEEIREIICKKGYIKAVISLPAKIYAKTNIAVSILVLENNSNSVRMIDATGLGKLVKNEMVLSSDDIDMIVNGMEHDSEISILVSTERLQQNDYSWDPVRYLGTPAQEVKNGVKLKDLAVFGRGKTIPRTTLEELMSNTPTDTQYLNLQNITDNQVDRELTSLKSYDKQYDNALVHTGDLLISRTAPFKVAVMPEIDNRKVIANGNFYVLTLDKKQVNPIYVMLHLRSAQGQQQLNFVAHGTALVSISAKDLEAVEIPMVSKEQQDIIASRYEALLDELDIVKRQETLIYNKIDALMEGGE